MPSKRRRRPGPKSVNRGNLGEESSSAVESDDRTADRTENIEPPKSPDLNISSELETENQGVFRTPDLENNATDYGLEFTTSQLNPPTPPRCSTMRTVLSSRENQQASTSRQAYSITKESTDASDRQPHRKKLPRKVKIQQATTKSMHPTPQESTTNTAEDCGIRPNTVVRRPRKQRTPFQLNKRFMKEVKALQQRTDNLVPMLPFSRLVREIMQDASSEITKITKTAMDALQKSTELYITQRLQDAYMLTLFRNRVTLTVKDMQMVEYFSKANL